jgi:hypothetical protein
MIDRDMLRAHVEALITQADAARKAATPDLEGMYQVRIACYEAALAGGKVNPQQIGIQLDGEVVGFRRPIWPDGPELLVEIELEHALGRVAIHKHVDMVSIHHTPLRGIGPRQLPRWVTQAILRGIDQWPGCRLERAP